MTSSVDKPKKTPARKPGGRTVMAEVAERAGVAKSSVSRVLSGHSDVSPVMRNRVLDAVAALNYQPDFLAQSLRTGETMTVGFLVADVSNPLMSLIALGAEVELREAGYTMFVTNSFNETDLDVAHVNQFQQRRVDGLLLSLSDEGDPNIRKTLVDLDVPGVLVDRQVTGANLSAVVSDHGAGLKLAVDHLADLGHTRIALVNDNRNVRPSRERNNSWRKAIKAHPHIDGLVRNVPISADPAYEATKELLADANPPTAIVAGSNQILVGVLRALNDLKLSYPDDISLITCDDFPFSEFLGITTISRDAREMGRVAGQLLLEQFDGKAPRRAVLPTSFRPTASCGKPAKKKSRKA